MAGDWRQQERLRRAVMQPDADNLAALIDRQRLNEIPVRAHRRWDQAVQIDQAHPEINGESGRPVVAVAAVSAWPTLVPRLLTLPAMLSCRQACRDRSGRVRSKIKACSAPPAIRTHQAWSEVPVVPPGRQLSKRETNNV